MATRGVTIPSDAYHTTAWRKDMLRRLTDVAAHLKDEDGPEYVVHVNGDSVSLGHCHEVLLEIARSMGLPSYVEGA